jgi:hypothetical protein
VQPGKRFLSLASARQEFSQQDTAAALSLPLKFFLFGPGDFSFPVVLLGLMVLQWDNSRIFLGEISGTGQPGRGIRIT